MGFCANELRELVIRPTLDYLGETGSLRAAKENLLLGTAAQESALGGSLGEGSVDNEDGGYGLYRISPQVHTAIWDDYLVNDPDLASLIRGMASQHEFLVSPHTELVTNLGYATAIAWVIYEQACDTFPEANDILAMGQCWEKYFQFKSNGSANDFVIAYKTLALGESSPIENVVTSSKKSDNNGGHLAA